MTSQVRDASSAMGIGNPILPRTASVGELILMGIFVFSVFPGGYPPYCPRINLLLSWVYAQDTAANIHSKGFTSKIQQTKDLCWFSRQNAPMEFSLFKE